MATGDIKGNIASLQRLLKHIKYPSTLDEVGYAPMTATEAAASRWKVTWVSFRLRLGEPLAVLPLLHYTLLQYSRHVAARIVQLGYQVRIRITYGTP